MSEKKKVVSKKETAKKRKPPQIPADKLTFGGRPAGSKNKLPERMRFDLLNTLKAHGFDPAAKLVQCIVEAEENYLQTKVENANKPNPIYRGQTTALSVLIDATSELMQYTYPKLKNVDFGKDTLDSFSTFTDMVKSIANSK